MLVYQLCPSMRNATTRLFCRRSLTLQWPSKRGPVRACSTTVNRLGLCSLFIVHPTDIRARPPPPQRILPVPAVRTCLVSVVTSVRRGHEDVEEYSRQTNHPVLTTAHKGEHPTIVLVGCIQCHVVDIRLDAPNISC